MRIVLDRLRERSTWSGAIAVAAALGWIVSPEKSEAIVAFAVAAIGIIGAVLRFITDTPAMKGKSA